MIVGMNFRLGRLKNRKIKNTSPSVLTVRERKHAVIAMIEDGYGYDTSSTLSLLWIHRRKNYSDKTTALSSMQKDPINRAETTSLSVSNLQDKMQKELSYMSR